MSKMVAAHYWVCEFCNKFEYDKGEIIKHLKEEHGIDCLLLQANMGTAGDNLIVSDVVIPAILRD